MERETGITVGNAIVVARSAAAFYSIDTLRDAYSLTFIRDILHGDGESSSSPGPYRNIHNLFPQWAKAIREFCAGKISITMFRFMGDKSTVPFIRNREAREDGFPDDVANDIY